MKLNRSLFAAMWLAWLLPLSGVAQDDVVSRDIVKQYQSGQVNGIELTIFLIGEAGSLTPVKPQRAFKNGERIKLALESNFGGYLYIVNYGSSRKQSVIFPCRGESNRIEPHKQYLLPKQCDFAFDENSGNEVMKVFTSRQPIAFLAAAAKRPDGMLNQREVARLNQWWQDGDAPPPGITGSTTKQMATRAMDSRDPVWDAKNKSALVTRRQKKGAGGWLVKNKVAMFKVSLKNTGNDK